LKIDALSGYNALQSYGGGVAAHIIGDSSAVFTCGVSVAPVANKAYYGKNGSQSGSSACTS